MHIRSRFTKAACAGTLSALAVAPVIANTVTGPSSSASPYLVRSVPGVVTKSILTVGDSVNLKPDGVTPYRMAGIPDGLGAFDNGDGTFTVLMNHEIPGGSGIVRAHGANGAFVSRWIVDKETLTVLHGEDLMQNVATWNTGGYYNAPAQGVAFSRFCSANLPARSALYDEASGLGYDDYLFMNGEESGSEGRAMAHAMDGTSYELPALGKAGWENVAAAPGAGVKTVVIGLDDSGNGQLYIHVGDKTASGNPAQMAGLTGGTLYGLTVTGYTTENASTGIPSGTPFTLHSFGDWSNNTGAALDTASVAAGVTGFQRPEDGAWDPANPNDFYFVTTASFTGKSRLWRLRFNDVTNPAAGGTIDMLLDGTEGQKMMDNITVTDRGQVVIQEDPGNQSYVARVWRYSVATDTLNPFAQHDPARFAPGAPNFLTQDEESSGVIDVSDILGEGWFLCDVQAHYATDAELVEDGQLLAIHYPPGRR